MPRRGARTPRGFTLVELLLSVALVAMMIVALAETMVGFGAQLRAVRADEEDFSRADALTELTLAVRHGWYVAEPAADRLRIVDARGDATDYYQDTDALMVVRPTGALGSVLDGVDAFTVTTSTSRRLRSAAEHPETGPWYENTASGTTSPLVIEESLPLALGFVLGTEAPDSVPTVSGVEEQAVDATLGSLTLPLTFVPPIDDPSSGGGGGSDKRVSICHVPPGNPDNAQTITVGSAAVDAHLAHGDYLVGCSPEGPALDPAQSQLVVELHEARVPGDSRPYGSPLGSVSFRVTGLPTGTWNWVAQKDFAAGLTLICHIPPGTATGVHSLKVPDAAVAAHLAHGDVVGGCENGDNGANYPILVFSPPGASLSIDLSAMGVSIEPVRAYTLLLRLVGSGSVLVGGVPIASAAASGTSALDVVGGAFIEVPYDVQRRIDGTVRYTQTDEFDVVSGVTIDLLMDDGERLSNSASVLSQTSVTNPWLGVIDGELPDLSSRP